MIEKQTNNNNNKKETMGNECCFSKIFVTGFEDFTTRTQQFNKDECYALRNEQFVKQSDIKCDGWLFHFQVWNSQTCGCTCKERRYKNCARRKQFVDEETCVCANFPPQTGHVSSPKPADQGEHCNEMK